jgi:hypothetical protein
MQGLTNEEKDLIFKTIRKLFSIGTIKLSKETISLLSVGILKLEALRNLIQNKGH